MSAHLRIAILAGARTPQAKAFSALSHLSAVELGCHATQAVMARSGLELSRIDEAIWGNVSGPADSANISRVIALKSGLSKDIPAHTVNRNCASGMEALIAASHSINCGRSRLVLAGGTESMSNIPFLVTDTLKEKLLTAGRAKTTLQKVRALARIRLRDLKPIPAIELGLTDPVCGLNMGETAEVLASEFGLSREEQDRYALESHKKALDASSRCFMSGEIAPIESAVGELKLDIGPRVEQSMQQLGKLKPYFRKGGSVTAGNSCSITDGATALILSHADHVKDVTNEPPLGYLTGFAIAGCDPKRMGLGPVFATAKLLKETGLSMQDFDLVELNEAFAAQVLACQRAFESDRFAKENLGRSEAVGAIDPATLNVNGGAIALGHPVGATGARMVLTLLRALKERRLKRGLATLCVGGGQGVAMVVETC